MHGSVSTTLQEAKPKAGSIRDGDKNVAETDCRQERSPEVEANSSPAERLFDYVSSTGGRSPRQKSVGADEQV
jgi:hypothetical protein